MQGFGKLDSNTIKRIESILQFKDRSQLNITLDNIINSMLEDGFNIEDIYDYVRGVLIEKLNEVEY